MSFKVPISDNEWLSVSDECKNWIAGTFQAALFIERGYNMPSPNIVTARIQLIVKSMRERNIIVDADTFFEELKKVTNKIYFR